MLFSLLSVALMQSAPNAPHPDPHDDIVVIAERMRRIRATTHQNRRTGAIECRIRRSSGDALLDQDVCGASVACAKTETEVAGMNTCMGARMPEIARRFADRKRKPG